MLWSSLLLACVGLGVELQPTWEEVQVGALSMCVRGGTEVACWGIDALEEWSPASAQPPAMGWSKISLGYITACGLNTVGRPVCWGPVEFWAKDPPDETGLVALAAGAYAVCGLRADRSLVCWGQPGANIEPPPAGAFTEIYALDGRFCARDDAAVTTCWGDGNFGPQVSFPSGDYLHVDSSFGSNVCAVLPSGKLQCWGREEYGQLVVPPGDQWRRVAVGNKHVCALDTAGEATCWGDEGWGRLEADPGPFLTLDAGLYSTCGIREDRSIACWGCLYDEQCDDSRFNGGETPWNKDTRRR